MWRKNLPASVVDSTSYTYWYKTLDEVLTDGNKLDIETKPVSQADDADSSKKSEFLATYCFDSEGNLYYATIDNASKLHVNKVVFDSDGSIASNSPINFPGVIENVVSIDAMAFDVSNKALYIAVRKGSSAYEIYSYKGASLNSKSFHIAGMASQDTATITAMTSDDNGHIYVSFMTKNVVPSYGKPCINKYTLNASNELEINANTLEAYDTLVLSSLTNNKVIYDIQVRGSNLYFTVLEAKNSGDYPDDIEWSGSLYKVSEIDGSGYFKDKTAQEVWGSDGNQKALTRFIARNDGELAIANDGFKMVPDPTSVGTTVPMEGNSIFIFNLDSNDDVIGTGEEKDFITQNISVCTFSRIFATPVAGSGPKSFSWK